MGEFETLDVGDKTVRLYVAGEMRAGAPGVVVLHAWWGLNDDAIAYADRLAAAGFAVTAPDMMGGQTATTIEDAERLSGAAESPDAEPAGRSDRPCRGRRPRGAPGADRPASGSSGSRSVPPTPP